MARERGEPAEQLLLALLEVAGHAFVIDEHLRVVGKTPGLSQVFGPLEVGVSAPKQICGAGTVRTMAEALARGEAMSSRIQRVLPGDSERAFYVRAVPLRSEGHPRGFLILVDDDTSNLGQHEGALAQYGIITQSPRMKALVDDIERVAQSDAAAARDGGTMLLDEIAELPLELQAKLLRVLEERSVIPVGGRDPIAIDVRFVSATHQSLRDAVAAGRFRADLMYRVRVIPLFLPSLRERKGDVALIAQHLVARFNERGKRKVERLTQGALAALDAYDWPGNVRELSNALEYAFAIGRGP